MKYLVVIEESEAGFGAYVPDLPDASQRRQLVKR